MATVILVRHGRTSANASGVLAGRTAGVALDQLGREQAERTGRRLADVPVAGLVTSPLERCRQTSRLILAGLPEPVPTAVDRRITECDYGEWQGRKLSELATEPLWTTVQRQPSAVTFPGGESMAGMQARSVAAIRSHDQSFQQRHGPGAVWVAVSHGDIIKAVLADALGMHLDLFQRITVGPASVSIVRYGEGRTEVIATNTESGDLGFRRDAQAVPAWSDPPPTADAAVGGGSDQAGTA